MATAAAFSLDVTTTGVTVHVPDHDLARLMYYLNCVTEAVGLSVLDDDLVNYKNYWRLPRTRRAVVLEWALLLSPGELINKLIFRDDEGAFTRSSRNEFCDISIACGVVSIQSDIIIAGKAQSISKVMFFKQSWLNDFYIRPLARAESETRHHNLFSRPFVLYIAPILYLAALFLSTFAYLSPAAMLHDRVALLTVTPSANLSHPGPVNGTSLFLGVLGSCSKKDNTTTVQCTTPALHPVYDLSVLSSAPKLSISSQVTESPIFIAVSLGCAFVFFILFNLTSFRHKMGMAGGMFDKPSMQKLSTWLGAIGFVIGLMSFVSLRVSLGKTAQSFNEAIQDPGYKGPQFIASTANGFIMLWVAYGLYAVSVIATLLKINVRATRSFWGT